ncbi:hypothetical protein [Halogeometricum sp. CBA1124]|uniref:hypothetical protein n=1 Tax=Halogeometricum sp. CBA1124 TaxID=2668071 RepID=UPI0014296F35|nr:hypothetical protein [Halogeometricum sp. CBA1124]MUV58645.1 hypothetical protein [Halogeometricum sp. CBA1124]
MNRDDVDVERLAGAAVFVLGFALLDVPATPVEYALCGLVVVGSLAATIEPFRANRTSASAPASSTSAWAAPNSSRRWARPTS